MLCTNKGCVYWAELISRREYGGTEPYSYSPQQTSKYSDIYSQITKSWEPEEKPKPEPKEKQNKRKRDDYVEQKHAVPRSGVQSNGASSASTFRKTPLEISIASWNVNHFKKAEKKKDIIKFLFEQHPWLDAVVLQEVSETGKKEVELAVSGLKGVKCAFGPMMQGISTGEEGPSKPKGEKRFQSTIGGTKYQGKEYTSHESFQLQDKDGNWVWMRPNQKEYHAILYRPDRYVVKEVFATYTGSDHLSEQNLYWAKEVHYHKVGTIPMTEELRTAFGKKGAIPQSVLKLLATGEDEVLDVTWGRASASREKKGSKTKKKETAAWERWRFTVNGVAYELFAQSGNLTLSSKSRVIGPCCRPAIVYELERVDQTNNPPPVFVAVVHTTPAGSKLNRALLKE
jgi:hypothetical protein